MAFIKSAIIVVLISMVAWPGDVLGGDVKKYVKIDAAFTYNVLGREMLYLFSGPEVQILVNGESQFVGPKERLGVPSDLNVTAAYRVDQKRVIYHGQGDYGVIFTKISRSEDKLTRFRYKKGSAGGPDAMGRRDGAKYLFHGCEVVEKLGSKKYGERHQLPDLGLPCDVDAAYSQGKNLIILKGDKIYEWWADGSTRGPYKNKYKLKNGWVILPAEK